MTESGILSELLADLNSCQYLFPREINELEQNGLTLLIEEGIASPESTSIEVAGTVISDYHGVTSGKDSRLFRVTWVAYIAYSVRNESYVLADEGGRFELGNLARVYSRSKFLEYVRAATIASNEYAGPSQHVQILCECHIIDVISTTTPTVRRLRP